MSTVPEVMGCTVLSGAHSHLKLRELLCELNSSGMSSVPLFFAISVHTGSSHNSSYVTNHAIFGAFTPEIY